MKNQLVCDMCGARYKYRTPKPNQKHFYCSKQCHGAHMTSTQIGNSNPNFGNKWSAETRSAASISKKKQFAENPNYAHECGKANRGVKFTTERIVAMHSNRTSDSYRHYPTDQVRKVIGEKSKEKWTPEFKKAFRSIMEAAGHWVPLDQVPPYKIYFKDANWICSMIEYFSAAETEMLTEHGIFGQQNTKGWVRDHIVARKCGYELGLPAMLLRHPANLQFISHADNVRKGFSDRKLTLNAKSAIIDSMFKRIENYPDWREQKQCLIYLGNL